MLNDEKKIEISKGLENTVSENGVQYLNAKEIDRMESGNGNYFNKRLKYKNQ